MCSLNCSFVHGWFICPFTLLFVHWPVHAWFHSWSGHVLPKSVARLISVDIATCTNAPTEKQDVHGNCDAMKQRGNNLSGSIWKWLFNGIRYIGQHRAIYLSPFLIVNVFSLGLCMILRRLCVYKRTRIVLLLRGIAFSFISRPK